jgi:hypothetical protein
VFELSLLTVDFVTVDVRLNAPADHFVPKSKGMGSIGVACFLPGGLRCGATLLFADILYCLWEQRI